MSPVFSGQSPASMNSVPPQSPLTPGSVAQNEFLQVRVPMCLLQIWNISNVCRNSKILIFIARFYKIGIFIGSVT